MDPRQISELQYGRTWVVNNITSPAYNLISIGGLRMKGCVSNSCIRDNAQL
jgi:hypothetical protein